jgi:hypothetical protein
MESPEIVNILFRWLHVAAAVTAIGGTIAMRFVILPVLGQLANGGEVLDQLRKPFKRLIHSAIGVLLLTGLYNYVIVAIPKVRALKEAGVEQMARYHMVMGTKILLALALFTIAILLLKPVPSLHENRKTWLSVNVVLGLLILLFSAYLRRLWPALPPGM